MKPLEGLLVIDFSQFLSGPSASYVWQTWARASSRSSAPESAIYAANCTSRTSCSMATQRSSTPSIATKKASPPT